MLGAGLFLSSSSSQIRCNARWSHALKEGGIKSKEQITSILNTLNDNNGGKMNFIRKNKRIPHTIINIPTDGVYLGFSCLWSSFTLHIESFRKLLIPPLIFNENIIKCVAYDFGGGFEEYSYNHKDEEGEEIINIGDYYK